MLAKWQFLFEDHIVGSLFLCVDYLSGICTNNLHVMRLEFWLRLHRLALCH